MFKRLLLLCLATLPLAPAAAADYPSRAIKMVVPFAPGGGTDILGRIIAQRLSEKWGQPVVVENQPGASGGIGTKARQGRAGRLHPADGLDRRADGGLRGAGAKRQFRRGEILRPDHRRGSAALSVGDQSERESRFVAELIALAREKPKALSFGSSGIGAASHLSGALFEKDAHVELLHVPYKGTGPAVADLLGGRIDMMFSPSTTVQAHVAAGKLKALATTGAKRSKFFADVPTVAESGLPGYASVGWFGLLAPAHTPKEIVDKLNKAVVEIMGEKDVIDRMAKLGAEPEPQTPDEFARFIDEDVAKWTKLVNEEHIVIPGAGK